MKALAVMLMGMLSLAACGPAAEKAEPTPAEKVSAAAPTSGPDTVVPVVMTADLLRRVCRAGLASIHGQTADAIEIDGLESQVVNASWRAPVDGGRRRAQCRVEGDMVTWKQVDAPNPEQNRWMNQSGDPVTRFAVDGGEITITTTLPDGTTATEEYAVAAEQEAR